MELFSLEMHCFPYHLHTIQCGWCPSGMIRILQQVSATTFDRSIAIGLVLFQVAGMFKALFINHSYNDLSCRIARLPRRHGTKHSRFGDADISLKMKDPSLAAAHESLQKFGRSASQAVERFKGFKVRSDAHSRAFEASWKLAQSRDGAAVRAFHGQVNVGRRSTLPRRADRDMYTRRWCRDLMSYWIEMLLLIAKSL